jgi:hypothetical protein
MTRFLLEQDSLAQSLLLGQIEQRDRPDLVEIVLKRLAVNGTGRRACRSRRRIIRAGGLSRTDEGE